jgi:uncharacterized membrane protein YidH (DUF202 family)
MQADFDASVDPEHFVWFRRFFLGKFVFLEWLSYVGAREHNVIPLVQPILVSVGALLAERQRGAWVGLLLVLLLKVAAIVFSAPYTINHAFFDAGLLLLLTTYSYDTTSAPSPLRIAQAGILIVFVQAGFQKLVAGYYTRGEFLAMRVLFDDGGMGARLRLLFGDSLTARPWPSWLVPTDISLPAWQWTALAILSNGVWIAEMGLPLMAMRASWRSRAIVGLLLLESAIFVLSGEVSFGFTTMACLLAFFPRHARWVYPGAFVVMAVCAVMLG